MLPEFAPVEIDDSLLGNGGLSLNVPFDPLLEEVRTQIACLPNSSSSGAKPACACKERCATRASRRLRSVATSRQGQGPKMSDYSHGAIGERWRPGLLDVSEALEGHRLSEAIPGLHVIRRWFSRNIAVQSLEPHLFSRPARPYRKDVRASGVRELAGGAEPDPRVPRPFGPSTLN